MEALFLNEELQNLLPQRPPIVMVDALYEASPTEALTGLTVQEDNIFVAPHPEVGSPSVSSINCLKEPGLIEHIAQSAAAFKGYENALQHLPPQLGYIGEIKKCRIYRLPQVGSKLITHIAVLAEAAGITLVGATTKVEDEVVAECQMKIFIVEK